ncbi:MAG: thymidine phosphorylase, partial [Myxococcota bacterium]
RRLAESLVRVGESAGVEVRAVLTAMEQPLGRTVGNALEVAESIEILRGEGPVDTTELTVVLASHMLVLGHAAKSIDEARQKAEQAIRDGSALDRLAKIIEAQGGDPRVTTDLSRLPAAAVVRDITAPEEGVVSGIDAFTVGMAAVRLGAGRARAEDRVDPSVGFELLKKVGDEVRAGDVIARVHAADAPGAEHGSASILQAYQLAAGAVGPKLIIDVME